MKDVDLYACRYGELDIDEKTLVRLKQSDPSSNNHVTIKLRKRNRFFFVMGYEVLEP